MSQPSKNAARLGEPSYVWRAGQNRRLEMIYEWGKLNQARRVFDFGTGLGLYLKQMQAVGPNIEFAAGSEYEFERAHQATPHGHIVNAAESLPFPDDYFDVVLSHEVLEHVSDDRLAVQEMARVLRPGGRVIIFVPNRLWLFETHGIYWRGEYHFGNKFGVNYLPDAIRNRLAPHVRAYTASDLRSLFDDLPMKLVHHTQIFTGYGKIVHRRPMLGQILRASTYMLEHTPLRLIGLSHLLIMEKVG